MRVACGFLIALALTSCGSDTESYNLTILVRTVIPPRTRFTTVQAEVFTPDEPDEALESVEYVTKEGDDFREAGIRVAETTLTQGIYRVVTTLLDQSGAEVASEEQFVVISADYQLSLQLGRELCTAFDTPLLTDAAVVAACQDKTWFECAQAADVLCTARSELNTESCWIGGFGYLEGNAVRTLCLGYAGAVRVDASLATLSAALGPSGGTTPLTEATVKTRRGAQAVQAHCISRGFGGGVGPLLVDPQMQVHFVCVDRDLTTVENARDTFFDSACSYTTAPETQVCSQAASTLCKNFDHAVGFGPVTSPEESSGVIEVLCL